jgi:hypothetical protein
MPREKPQENKIDVRLYGTRSNPAEFQTLNWIQANKKAAIDFLTQAKRHEVLRFNDGSAQDVQRAIAQAILFHRYIADSLELQIDNGFPVNPSVKVKNDLPKILSNSELPPTNSGMKSSVTIEPEHPKQLLELDEDDDDDEMIVTAPPKLKE